MKNSKIRRVFPEVNASSMADIAFLLLIFFLVTTEIVEDKGILVRLPPMPEVDEPVVPLPPRNVFTVLVNGANELLVEGAPLQIDELRVRAKDFILNPEHRLDLPSSPTKAVISLRNDRETSYESYINVYNELQGAYNELWSELSQEKYGVPYSEDLPIEQRQEIKAAIPFVLSEAEPTNSYLNLGEDLR